MGITAGTRHHVGVATCEVGTPPPATGKRNEKILPTTSLAPQNDFCRRNQRLDVAPQPPQLVLAQVVEGRDQSEIREMRINHELRVAIEVYADDVEISAKRLGFDYLYHCFKWFAC